MFQKILYSLQQNILLDHDFATPYVTDVIVKLIFKQLTCTSCENIMTTREDLPENIFIKEKEYAGCQLIHLSTTLSTFVRNTTTQILHIIPRMLPLYGVKNQIFNVIMSADIPQNMFCDEYENYMSVLLKIIINVVFSNYLKKVITF